MSGPVFRTRLTERGGHVEVTVFAAASDDATGANCGTLLMRPDEAKAFERVHATNAGVVEALVAEVEHRKTLQEIIPLPLGSPARIRHERGVAALDAIHGYGS